MMTDGGELMAAMVRMVVVVLVVIIILMLMSARIWLDCHFARDLYVVIKAPGNKTCYGCFPSSLLE